MLQAYRLLHVVLRDATQHRLGLKVLLSCFVRESPGLHPRSFAEDSGFSRRIYFYPENWACCTSNGLDPQQMEAGIAPLTSIVTACKDSQRQHFILCLSPSLPLPSLFLFTHSREHSPWLARATKAHRAILPLNEMPPVCPKEQGTAFKGRNGDFHTWHITLRLGTQADVPARGCPTSPARRVPLTYAPV